MIDEKYDILDVRSGPWVTYQRVEPASVYVRVLHDFEYYPNGLPRMLQKDWKRSRKKGVPETVNLMGSGPCEITEEYQRFIYETLRQYAPPSMTKKQIRRAYRKLLGSREAWTNRMGYPQGPFGIFDSRRADWVNKRDLDKRNPFFDNGRTSGGSVHKLLSDKTFMRGGVPCKKILTWKFSDGAPEPWLTPQYFIWCSTATPEKLEDGRYRCNPFPQLQGNDVPLLLVTKAGYGYIESKRLVEVDSPFVNHYVP